MYCRKICGQMTENPEFDPLGVGDANDVIYGTFIGMITAITILIIHCFAHGEDACGMSPQHGRFWNSSLGEHTLQGKSASLRHPGSIHHGDIVCPHLPDVFGRRLQCRSLSKQCSSTSERAKERVVILCPKILLIVYSQSSVST
jgi:hypothetical protein